MLTRDYRYGCLVRMGRRSSLVKWEGIKSFCNETACFTLVKRPSFSLWLGFRPGYGEDAHLIGTSFSSTSRELLGAQLNRSVLQVSADSRLVVYIDLI